MATVGVVFLTMVVRRNAPTEILFGLALTLFVVCGVIQPERAWHSLADSSVIAIGGLLVISAALKTTGALDLLGHSLLGSARSERHALSRLAGVVVGGSAFLLNTAIVAMLLPMVISWCRRHHISPSKLLMPISYLAILGGTCTLVGTSTNFVINGMLSEMSQQASLLAETPEAATDVNADEAADLPQRGYSAVWMNKYRADLSKMNLLEISRVGIPCALAGAAFLILFGRHLLPDREELLDSLEDQRREYLVEMIVSTGCALIGKTVEEGGLRNLPGLFLIEIDRDGQVISPVAPTDRIYENDQLVFTGVVSTIVDLKRIEGLVPAVDQDDESPPLHSATRCLVEVVLSPTSPLVGSTIRKANFRQHYGAAVVAVHRNGEHLPSKIGNIELSPGDTLLLQTQQSFVRSFRNRPDFYLVSGVEDSDARRPDKRSIALGIALAMIAWLFLMPFLPNWLRSIYPDGLPAALTMIPVAILTAAMGMIATRCVSVADARRAIDLPLLLTIGAAIGVGRGISDCGAADLIAKTIVNSVGNQAYLGLAVIFILTVLFTEMISNVAVAATMFYVAVGLASHLDASPRPFIMAVTLAASLSFISPIGYQTNLMVMGPGGYRMLDYVKAGLPLTVLVGAIALALIPLIWPFY